MNETKKHTNEQLKLLSEAMKEFGGVITLPVSLAVELKEYERVNALPWEKVAAHVENMKYEGYLCGPAGFFYVNACEALLRRYKKGERTQELFDEMNDVH